MNEKSDICVRGITSLINERNILNNTYIQIKNI